MPTQQQFIKAIPVTSFDEAKAAMIDFDGSLFIFANIQNGEIYTKQLNINTGSCDLKVYSLLNNLGNQGAADTGLFVVVSSNLCIRNCGTVTHIPVTTTSSVAEA